jgi:hypothetical protein
MYSGSEACVCVALGKYKRIVVPTPRRRSWPGLRRRERGRYAREVQAKRCAPIVHRALRACTASNVLPLASESGNASPCLLACHSASAPPHLHRFVSLVSRKSACARPFVYRFEVQLCPSRGQSLYWGRRQMPLWLRCNSAPL